MTSQQEQIKLRQQLCLMTDAYITLSDNPVWLEMVAQHPELETVRQTVIQSSDNLWYAVRTRIISTDSEAC